MERETSFPKDQIKVLLLENIHPEAHRAFKGEGYAVETEARSLGEEELRERIGDVFILGIRSKTHLGKPLFEESRKLIAIGAFCIGTEQIDIRGANRVGAAVFNAPFSNTRSVAELALGQMIMASRGIFEKNNQMHQGTWNKVSPDASELRGKTLGIIGYGKIGSQISVLTESLGMQVVFYNTSEVLSLGNAKKINTMEEILENSDIVSVHVSGKPSNRNLISAEQFQIMRSEAIFINLSRGYVVDLEALSYFLKSGKLKGAAIDVFPDEPQSDNEEFHSVLQEIPNVILTPHIGGSTREAQVDIARFVSGKIINFVNSGDTQLSVNYPNIQLPSQADSHRFLHLHRNVPGIMARINSILAEREINILGQYLQTEEELGYVITDVNKQYSKGVISDLKRVPETIKFRVLY